MGKRYARPEFVAAIIKCRAECHKIREMLALAIASDDIGWGHVTEAEALLRELYGITNRLTDKEAYEEAEAEQAAREEDDRCERCQRLHAGCD